jgi:hypothetical protein
MIVFSSLRDSAGIWLGTLPRPAKLSLLAAGVALVAFGVLRALGGDDRPPTAAPVQAAPSIARPGGGAVMLRRTGLAVLGTLQSTDGAAAAALSYVQQRNVLLAGGTSARDAAEVGSKIAVGGHDVGRNPASLPDLAAEEEPKEWLATRAGQIAWWTVPFGYRLLRYAKDGGRATVRVFSGLVAVRSDPAAGPTSVTTSLRDVRLVWRGGAWRIDRVVDAPDQPTAALSVAIDANQIEPEPGWRDRILPTREPSSVGLFRWLQGATPIISGPLGMGQVDGALVEPQDARALVADAHAGTLQLARTAGVLEGGSGNTWQAQVPLAFRPMRCPSEGGDGRCYATLLVGASLEREGGMALVRWSLAGARLSGEGGELRTEPVNIDREDQLSALGGQVEILAADVPARRAGAGAWQRSVVPLRPTIAAVPR